MLISSIFLSIGCTEKTSADSVGETPGETQKAEARLTESNQQRLISACPSPELKNSLERENLKKRLEFLNDANKDLYVALLSNDGKVLATYVTNGKVSSLNSYLTTNEQIVEDPYGYGEGRQGQILESPDLDGSYGYNNEGIFFFTTDGAYIEWNGPYIESSQPFTLATPPIIVTTMNTSN
ncbi:MAG: hypothetical protein ABFD07_00500 [Methanobacterium sp.]